MVLRKRLKNWYLRFTEFKWIVGVAEFDSASVFDTRKKLRIHWIKNNPKASWFADPFILSETSDHLCILVEEYFYANKKGRISKLVVNRHNWRLEKIIPLIDIPSHLSFPAYYRKDGRVYIYPESTKSGRLTLYKYDEKEEVATPVKDISSHPLADAVLYVWENQEVILATTSPKDNGRILDIYPCNGDPSAEPESRIMFDTNVARNAGIPFSIGSRTIRPAQDCSRSYGRCVVLQEMIVEEGQFHFEELRRLYSPLLNYREAFHTFNVFKNRLVAVDAEGFRYGILAQTVHTVRELFRK